MAAKWIAECGLRSAEWRTAVIGIALAGLFATVTLADNYSKQAAQVAALSSEQKAELLRKKDRFDKLTGAEKQRLRDLHAELSASPDAATLETVMRNYCNWLRYLPPRDRDEVLSMPTEDRIKRIKEIVKRQEARRLRDYVTYYLPKADHEVLYTFLDNFVKDHEQEILDRLEDNERRWIRRIDDDAARRKALIPKLFHRFRDSKMPFPTIEEMLVMAGTLSPETQKEIDSQTGAKRDDRVRDLVWAAIGSISIRPPSDDELRKFFAGLSSEDKGRLEEMDADGMKKALRYMWRIKQMGGRSGYGRGDGSRGPRPPGPPPGSRPPGPPPGFASPK